MKPTCEVCLFWFFKKREGLIEPWDDFTFA